MFQSGWPPEWRDAEVRALWKGKGSKDEVENYRPVVLLSATSRIVERLALSQLSAHAERIGLFPDSQHGFRQKHSCETALRRCWRRPRRRGRAGTSL